LRASLLEAGLDAGEVCREAGLDPELCDDPEARVPVTALHALWEAELARGVSRDAALSGATRYAPSDYALVGFVCMHCATLGEALQQLARYLELWTDEPRLTLEADATLRLTYATSLPDRPGLRMATEATLAEVLHNARQVLSTELVPRSVSFTHPSPPSSAAYDAFFGTRVRWEQPHSELGLWPEQLALEIPRDDPALGAFLRDIANQALASRADAPSSLQEELRSLLAEELSKGVPTLDRLARRMATSPRTLRRRLESEGTSFRDLLDETRADLARSYVAQGAMSLCEVAFLLGFSEPSAFHRAFKRWTGSTPASFRRRHA
jgi:AraC-like DNA-binding protein